MKNGFAMLRWLRWATWCLSSAQHLWASSPMLTERHSPLFESTSLQIENRSTENPKKSLFVHPVRSEFYTKVWTRRIFQNFAAEGHFRQGRMKNPKGDGCGEIDRGKLAFSWQARHRRQCFWWSTSFFPAHFSPIKGGTPHRISKITAQSYTLFGHIRQKWAFI